MPWDETEPIAVLDNGFGIYRLESENDRLLHKAQCDAHCVHRPTWIENFRLGLQLYTIRDQDDVVKGIICACEARKLVDYVAGTSYTPYSNSRAGDLSYPVQFPNGESLVILELCPPDVLWSDDTHENMVPVVEWLHTLDRPEGRIGEWNHRDGARRTVASELRRELEGGE